MNNLKSFHKEDYQPANKLKYSVYDRLAFEIYTLGVAIKLIIAVIVALFNEVFKRKEPKIIRGQLALVTGR